MTTDTSIQIKITGYWQLTPAEAELMNEGKALAEQCGAYVAKLQSHMNSKPVPGVVSKGEVPPLDQRWIALGATQLQQGFMAVIRGIAQPTTF